MMNPEPRPRFGFGSFINHNSEFINTPMRSIRRSLLGYFLLLLALALGAVAWSVDRFAVDAIRGREASETERIGHAFESRRLREQTKFDAELVVEARALAGELNRAIVKAFTRGRGPGGPPGKGPEPKAPEPKAPEPKLPADQRPPGRAPDAETREYIARVAGLLFQPPVPGALPPTATAAYSTYRPWSPTWVGFETPRAAARMQVPEMLRRLFEDEGEHAGFYQFNVLADYPGRPWQTLGTVRPARLAHDLPLDPDVIDEPDLEALPQENVEVGGKMFRRAVVWTVVGAQQVIRPLAIPVWLDPQTYPAAPPAKGPVVSVFFPPSAGLGMPVRPRWSLPHADVTVRVFVQAARPVEELEARLVDATAERDGALDNIRRESREALAELRTKLGLIGAGSFLALVGGGWFIVARGLAPVRTLSDAVSRVSEKDFALTVFPADLSVELAPIHARLTQTLDQLRAAFAREKEAVADISHELRTPIASLLATIDVTLRKPRTPEQYRTTLEDCRGIAKQLGQLVERIMTLASLDAGAARGAVSRVDAADLAGSCAVVIRPLAESHGQTFALAAPGPAELDTDPDRLREILMNLLHNAVEYNRPGGRVELAVRAADGRVVFEVRDTGIGMTPEVRAKIFERFYRADPSRTATGVHAGLGLAIVKEYVDRLGGTIAVESTPGEGTVFRVSFPAAPPGESEEPAPARPAA